MDYKKVSRERIAKLQPAVAQKALDALEQAWKEGLPILVVQGLRTFAEQNGLYAQGRTKSGSIVTNAKGGQSSHNFGLAFDICLYVNGKPIWTVNSQWKRFVTIVKSKGFSWGGDWKSFKDYPHFEMLFGKSLAHYRSVYLNGYQPSMKPSTPLPTPTPSVPILGKGDKGEAVETLQTLLNKRGYKFAVDSIFGTLTENAVKDFQKKNGLVSDGLVGVKTLQLLKAPVATPKPKYILPTGILKFGDKGTAVKQLQTALKALDYKIVVDSIMGNRTVSALKSFQKAVGINQDGVYGSLTKSKLSAKLN
jgi:peptidoglycan L-alanyl-D-glutamate endopeptidase CwlK